MATSLSSMERPLSSLQPRRPRAGEPAVLGVIAAGGALGSLARWTIAVAWPAEVGGFPWATFAVNVSGCLLIGGLMVLVTEVWTGRRLLRPFLGVGVLGGYTTFSTYAVDATGLFRAGAPYTALAYLAATLTAALFAVYAATVVTRRFIRPATLGEP